MSDIFHINISSNATNKIELYKIQDNDLKNKVKKRGRWEWAFGISILESRTEIAFFIGIGKLQLNSDGVKIWVEASIPE